MSETEKNCHVCCRECPLKRAQDEKFAIKELSAVKQLAIETTLKPIESPLERVIEK